MSSPAYARYFSNALRDIIIDLSNQLSIYSFIIYLFIHLFIYLFIHLLSLTTKELPREKCLWCISNLINNSQSAPCHYCPPNYMGLNHITMGMGTTIYRQVSNIRGTLVGNKIVDHSDVVGASTVGAAQTASSLST